MDSLIFLHSSPQRAELLWMVIGSHLVWAFFSPQLVEKQVERRVDTVDCCWPKTLSYKPNGGLKCFPLFFLYQNKLILIFHFTLYFFEVPLFTQERNVWCDYWNLQSQQAKRALGSRSVLACSSVTMACIDPDSKCIQPLVWNVVSCKNKLAFYFPEKGGVAAQ